MTKTDLPLISIVIPVFNEAENIDLFLERLDTVMQKLRSRFTFELLFTDNHSTDATFATLIDRATRDDRIHVIRFSRNFGYQKSILTGYLNARGQAAIQLDVDLQDPPELIVDFLDKWEDGFDVVYGIRRRRENEFFLSFVRRIFYALITALSEHDLPRDAGDFQLVDRRVLNVLRRIRDQNPYLRGTIAAMGFNRVGIEYDRKARICGSTKFSMSGYFRIAIDGIVSQSVIPLRLATYSGIAVAFTMMVAIAILIIGSFLFGTAWPRGFATTTLLILLGISLNAMFLGIIGEYIARIYHQTVLGPLTITEATFPSNMPLRDGNCDARDKGRLEEPS